MRAKIPIEFHITDDGEIIADTAYEPDDKALGPFVLEFTVPKEVEDEAKRRQSRRIIAD